MKKESCLLNYIFSTFAFKKLKVLILLKETELRMEIYGIQLTGKRPVVEIPLIIFRI